jgi:hypothetical protein
VTPIHSLEIGKFPIHRIAMSNASVRRPEREAIVEGTDGLILELQRPIRAAVHGFINPKIGWVVTDGQQIGNLVADTLHIAELERFCAGHDAGPPRLTAIGGDDECAPTPTRPHDPWVDRANRDQSLGCATLLRRQCGLMNPRVILCKTEESAGKNGS